MALDALSAFQLSMLPLPNGDGEIRTLDPLLARQVLSQLSYTPTDRNRGTGFGLPSSGLASLFIFAVKPMGLSGPYLL